MLFNAESLAPLFEFKIGQPGSSFTFEVAQINGVSDVLISKAKEKLDNEKLKLNDLLSDLQRKNNDLDSAIKSKQTESSVYKEKAEEASITQERLKYKFDQVNQTIQLHESQLAAGKKMLEFIAKYKNARGKNKNKDLQDEVMLFLKQQKTKKEVKKKSNKPNRKLSKKQVESYRQENIKIGSKVKIISTKQAAVVEGINGNQVVLSMGNIRIKVDLAKLILVS